MGLVDGGGAGAGMEGTKPEPKEQGGEGGAREGDRLWPGTPTTPMPTPTTSLVPLVGAEWPIHCADDDDAPSRPSALGTRIWC